jgi:hypothetical protein
VQGLPASLVANDASASVKLGLLEPAQEEGGAAWVEWHKFRCVLQIKNTGRMRCDLVHGSSRYGWRAGPPLFGLLCSPFETFVTRPFKHLEHGVLATAASSQGELNPSCTMGVMGVTT